MKERQKRQESIDFRLQGTLKAMGTWYSTTDANYRTVDNLLNYLLDNKQFLPFSRTVGKRAMTQMKKDDAVRWLNTGFLLGYLHQRRLDFVLTSLAVDTIVHPTKMHEGIEEVGYRFFLEHYHEHSWLEERIKKSVSSPLRLRVQPVYPADDDLMAWLFEPWEMKVFTLSSNPEGSALGLKKSQAGERFVSVSNFSILEEYTGDQDIFSTAYLERVRKIKGAN